MKIYGVGTDIVKIKRIKDSIKKESFITRIFNDVEISKCNKTIKSIIAMLKDLLQKRLSKALGTGISKGINFNEIVVLNEKMENHLLNF